MAGPRNPRGTPSALGSHSVRSAPPESQQKAAAAPEARGEGASKTARTGKQGRAINLATVTSCLVLGTIKVPRLVLGLP